MCCWSRLRRFEGGLLLAFAAGLTLLASGLVLQPDGADAARDERTITLYEIHLKETTTVTFKRDGKFIPSALKKLNWAMRDWRTGVATKMDPKLFDLVWQLHKDVGSKKPIHVISGHRTAKTNAKLRRTRGGQARKSQHVLGHAMDIHFPDVPMSKVREAAFLHEVGGVGYYPTSAIPFVHVDTARVRSWPRMSRSQLAMLFPHGKTRHLPAKGGPLTERDRRKARIRIAALERKKRSRTSTLLARASIPAGRSSSVANRKGKAASPVVLASLAGGRSAQTARPRPSTLEVPGLSRHASRLWVNSGAGRAISDGPADSTADRPKAPSYRLAGASQEAISGQEKGSSHAKSIPAQARPATSRPAAPRARLQLASLSPQKDVRPDPGAKLWINGSGLRASWLTEQEAPATPPAPAAQTAPSPVTAGIRVPEQPLIQKAVQHRFSAERVAYAPSFDEEHPDELSYRPFQILPLMSSKPVALNKTLVAMVEPEYDRVHELLASSENIPMQFRPSSRDAEALWNNQFKGNAILNIRKQAHNRLLPARPQRLAAAQ